MKHTDTQQTLANIDATLRLTDKALWEDPEFQAWEDRQVSPATAGPRRDADNQPFSASVFRPGPQHWLSHAETRPRPTLGTTVAVQPLIRLVDDHDDCPCNRRTGPYVNTPKSMHLAETDYPEHTTTHGPLLLGPEPDEVFLPSSLLVGHHYRDRDGCVWKRTESGLILTGPGGQDLSQQRGGILRLPEEVEEVASYAPYTPA